MDTPSRQHWHHLSVSRIARFLDTEVDGGLDHFEIERRQQQFGPNALPAVGGHGAFTRFLLQFHQPLVYILLAAVMVTLLLQEWIDASVILGVVLVNAAVGYLQETKAVEAFRALARTMRTRATVLRSGERQEIPSEQLVPGDVVILKAGDKVPADLRLFHCVNLQSDESMLTGESVPVQKKADELAAAVPLADRSNMAYSSTLVTQGAGSGIVVATGAETEVGLISQLVRDADQIATPLTKKIKRFSGYLLVVILVLAGLTLAVGLLRGQPLGSMFMAAVALAVGAIPEGLPAAVTITLAIGVRRMAQRHAIIRKLPAVETLGSTTVICSDKTGTLTENQMAVREIWAGGETYEVTGPGFAPLGELASRNGASVSPAENVALSTCLSSGSLCNDSSLRAHEGRWSVHGDPTEGALLAVAAKHGLEDTFLKERFPRIATLPFESEYQYMATLHDGHPGQPRTVFVKGAVERLLERCHHALDASGNLVELVPGEVLAKADEMAARGMRVLAFARSHLSESSASLDHADVSENLTFLGLQGMIDPPRQEVVGAVSTCRRAGVVVKMITGDHPLTASVIAEQLGIGPIPNADSQPHVLTGAELAQLTDDHLIEAAEQSNVFARVTPEQKLRLVQALQARGHVVAMTGDGVNDAPALKQADIGVAMGITGTEVAKEAADMVLTDDNFATIEAAVEEGRGVFDNLTKFIVWTLPTNLGEGLVILAAVLIAASQPILPVQILWINMTTAVLLGLMLAFEPKESGIMSRPPRDPATPILTGTLIVRIVLVGMLLLLGAFGLFEWALYQGASEAVARTIAVNVFVFTELFYLFNCRSLTKSMFALGIFSNPWIWFGAGAMTVLQLFFTYSPLMNRLFGSAPLGWSDWVPIIVVSFTAYITVGTEKWLRRRSLR